MTLTQHHQNQTKILVAETVFKGVFTKSKVISHLSDKVAPNELKTILNQLLNEKIVRVGEIKEILEIEESKLNELKGVKKNIVVKTTKIKKSPSRKVRYTLNKLSTHYSLTYIFYFKQQRVRDKIKLSLDTNIEALDINSFLELHIKESNPDYKYIEFDFYRFIPMQQHREPKEKKIRPPYQPLNIRKVGWLLKRYKKTNTYSIKYRLVYKMNKKQGIHYLGKLLDKELDVSVILPQVIKEKYPETKDLEFTFTYREFT